MRLEALILSIVIGLPGMALAQLSDTENRAVILVIDKSGSMRDESRMVYATGAAKAVAGRLKDNDRIGLIGFDDRPFVLLYLDTMARLRGVIEKQLDRLKPGGQTDFLPALAEAKRQLERVNVSHKHVVLLSDGGTRDSERELMNLVSDMKNKLKITVSSVAITKDANVRIMKLVAQSGGGFFQLVCDASTLPQKTVERFEANDKTPGWIDESQECQ